MSTTIDSVHQTSFGMFVPCDKATYKKLKRIFHLFTQFVRPWEDRWQRSQARQLHNRHFTLRKVRYEVKDSWVFRPFSDFLKNNRVVPSDLWRDFSADYWAARTPVKTPEEVKSPKLSVAQIDKLLMDIEAFVATAK